MRTDLVILRAWRDGSIHAEIPVTTFPSDDDEMLTHVDNRERSHIFETLCGIRWFGKLSASGWQHSESVDCPKCRELLLTGKGN